jgi:hypothetical protein
LWYRRSLLNVYTDRGMVAELRDAIGALAHEIGQPA